MRMRSLAPFAIATCLTACSEREPVPVANAEGGMSTFDASIMPAPTPGADASLPKPALDAGRDCDIFVADSLIEHACFHAVDGPFRDREATSDALNTASVEVNRAHTAFRIRLPEAEAGFAGRVSYEARWAGGYALFTDPAVEVSVDEGKAPILPFSKHETELCGALPWVSAYLLRAGVHELLLRSDVPDVVLVAEYMDEGEVSDGYRFECPDQVRPRLDAGPQSADASTDAGSPAGWDAATSDSGLVPTDSGAQDAATSDSGTVRDAGPACTIDPVLEHSCLHVTYGPFATVASVASGTPPNVNTVHTSYTVQLPQDQAGLITYRPTGSGPYVFYLGSDVALRLIDPLGSELSASHVEVVTACAGLETARVYDLTSGTKYQLAIGPGDAQSVTLIIENVESLAPAGWEQRFEACE